MHPPLFSHPLRVNGMAGVSLAPMPPGIALKTAAARYAPLRLHLADRPDSPCLDLPSGRLIRPTMPSPNGARSVKNASRRFSCPGETGPGRTAFSSAGLMVRNIPPFWQQQTLAPTTEWQHGISKKMRVTFQ
jgi:hypothetical protein